MRVNSQKGKKKDIKNKDVIKAMINHQTISPQEIIMTQNSTSLLSIQPLKYSHSPTITLIEITMGAMDKLDLHIHTTINNKNLNMQAIECIKTVE